MKKFDSRCFTNDEIAHLGEAIKGLQFGYVQIVVQNGKIVQIDRLEKFRLDKKDQERR
ncbi:MAG: YezD family protein [bacterium]|nr:YezD family protein [bacterium]